MSTSRQSLAQQEQLLASATHQFLWDEWAQLGVRAPSPRASQWAADPEALVVFTLCATTDEPRLFDETLDWMTRNRSVLSRQRALNLARRVSADKNLVEAAFEAARGSRHAKAKQPHAPHESAKLTDLFEARGSAVRVERPDPTFLQFGYRRPMVDLRRHSGSPDERTPIAFAFRMRDLFGANVRADAMRYLLLAGKEASASEITDAAGYSKRNIAEGLNGLARAGAISARKRGNQLLYSADRSRWAAFLGIRVNSFPANVAWPAFFASLWQLLQWMRSTRDRALDAHVLASALRDLIANVGPGFEQVGIQVPATDRHHGLEITAEFDSMLRRLAKWLQAPVPPRSG